MRIVITPQEQISSLQQENAKLRALVGEREPEPVQEERIEGIEPTPIPTLIQQTDDLSTVVGLMSEVIL